MIARRGDAVASSNQPTRPSTLSPWKDVRHSTGAAALLAAEADEIQHVARVRFVRLEAPSRAFHGALTFQLWGATVRTGNRVCSLRDESLSSLQPRAIVDQHCILSSLNVHRKPTYFKGPGSVMRAEGHPNI